MFMIFTAVTALALSASACGDDNQSSDSGAGSADVLQPPRQTSQSGDVEVGVVPVGLTKTAATWDFSISIDSRGAELNEDMTAVAVLVDDSGKEFKPVSFDGDPPGGTHREGTLKFNPISPEPKSITLKLRHVGGIGERSFSWTMAAASLGSTPLPQDTGTATDDETTPPEETTP